MTAEPVVHRGPLLAVLAVLTALAPFSIDVYTPSLPRIHEDLGGPDWAAQASITACLLGIGVGQLLLGPLSDRVGRRPVILAGVTGWTIASLVSALVPSVGALVAARALAGLSGAAGIVVARSVVRDVSDSPRTIGVRISLLATVSSAAPILAPAVGTAAAAAAGWRADFLALAVLGALALVAALLLVPETSTTSSRAARGSVLGPLGGALRDRELRSIALALAAQAFGFYAYVATASFVIEGQLHHGPGVFAAVFGTNAAAMLAANLLFRRLVRSRTAGALLGTGLGAALAAGVLMSAAAATHAPEELLWAGSLLFAASMGFVLPGAHGWGQLTGPASGAASGLTGSAQFLGGVLGSPATGLLGPTALTLGLIVAGSSAVALLPWRVAARARSGGARIGPPRSPIPEEGHA